ncbi:hypothetical protein [Bradyrhizobium betae]|uniref:hypothetical protein n=1 Tax=Bradyrhizobium betae TaxID=244734 RepID=UPI0035B624DA
MRLAGAEALTIGTVGVVLGIALAGLVAWTSWRVTDARLIAPYFALAAAVGFALAIAALSARSPHRPAQT